MSERREVAVTIKCQHQGFGFDLDASLCVDQIPGLVAKLQEQGITPANSQYVWSQNGACEHKPAGETESGTGEPPLCPVHAAPMKLSKYGGFFCSRKNGDGNYCKYKS